MGPERPDLKMQQQSIDRGRTYTRSFSSSLYANRSWLAGCSVSDAFFLFSLPVVGPTLVKHTMQNVIHLSESLVL